ncbi:Uncharacterised protein [uncultured archaeon]|nr:Uncharacterised protein [uncultured archaeon]
MRWPWKQEIRHVQPRQVSTKQLELQTAKEILAEVFHTRASDVDEMIKRRLEEWDRREELEEGLWPAAFCLGE